MQKIKFNPDPFKFQHAVKQAEKLQSFKNGSMVPVVCLFLIPQTGENYYGTRFYGVNEVTEGDIYILEDGTYCRIEFTFNPVPSGEIKKRAIKPGESYKKFQVGRVYWMRSIGDAGAIWECKVIRRTQKTVTLEIESEGTKTRRISIYDGEEQCSPLGKYSFSPTLRASKVRG